MAESFDELVDRAVATLRKLGMKKEILNTPIEECPLADLPDILDFTIKSLDGIGEVVRREGQAVNLETLQGPISNAEAFYTKLLQLGYFSVGSVITALRFREVPEPLVAAAAQTAYLHRQVREVISSGYGIKPLEPP